MSLDSHQSRGINSDCVSGIRNPRFLTQSGDRKRGLLLVSLFPKLGTIRTAGFDGGTALLTVDPDSLGQRPIETIANGVELNLVRGSMNHLRTSEDAGTSTIVR
jgi:hypothetical protein